MHAPPAVNSADEGINFERELEEIAQGEFELPLDQLTRGELCLLFEKYRARRLSMGLPLPEVAAHLVQAADKEARQFAEQSTLLKHAMRRVRFLSVFSPTIRQAFGFARVGSALEDVAPDVRVRLNRTDEILRQQTWSSPELERALVVTACQDPSHRQTIVRVCGEGFAEMNIVLPGLLDPAEVARAVLGALGPLIRRSLDNRQPVVIFDGDFENINMKEAFEGAQVIRSIGRDVEDSANAIVSLLRHPPPAPDNAVVISGVPASNDQCSRVFRPASETEAALAWDAWAGAAERWEQTAVSTGFEQRATNGATREEVLEALIEKSHVLVIVAHAETETIFLPEPPPGGSTVTGDDLRAVKEQISRNRPLVYLFCCETAAIENLDSISRVLLECGVAGVVAPRTKLPERRARELMQALGESDARAGSAVVALAEAEERSGCSDMETFVR